MGEEVTWKVLWANRALCDLERIIAYLNRRNPSAALKLGQAILKKTDLLGSHPELGAVLDEDPECRIVPQSPYKIYYRLLAEERSVEVLHVRHGSQDAPTYDDLGKPLS